MKRDKIQIKGLKDILYILLSLCLLFRGVYAASPPPNQVATDVNSFIPYLGYSMMYVFENIIGEGWLTAWILVIIIFFILHYVGVRNSVVIVSVAMIAILTSYAIGWAQGTLTFMITVLMFFILVNWVTGIKG